MIHLIHIQNNEPGFLLYIHKILLPLLTNIFIFSLQPQNLVRLGSFLLALFSSSSSINSLLLASICCTYSGTSLPSSTSRPGNTNRSWASTAFSIFCLHVELRAFSIMAANCASECVNAWSESGDDREVSLALWACAKRSSRAVTATMNVPNVRVVAASFQ